MPPAISDDEQSDTSDVIAIPLKEKRAKSRSAEYRDDVLETKNEEEDIPEIKGDLNGGTAKSIAKSDEDENDEDADEDEDLEPDEFVVEKILDHQVAEDVGAPLASLRYSVTNMFCRVPSTSASSGKAMRRRPTRPGSPKTA